MNTSLLSFFFLLVTGFLGLSSLSNHHHIDGLPVGTIKEDHSKLRICESLSCDIISVLHSGQQVGIIEELHEEEIGNYGINPWFLVSANGKRGFIYGGLIRVSKTSEIIRKKFVFLNRTDANLRSCTSTKCKPQGVIKAGTYLEVVQYKNKNASSSWLKVIRSGKGKQSGYVYKNLTQTGSGNLVVHFPSVNVYDAPNGHIVTSINRGSKFSISSQTVKSQVKQPYGRHYWYRLKSQDGRILGWVYGAGTNKEKEPVDCQCVDFIKHKMNIKGPTKNAFEWGEILTGNIEIQKGKKRTRIDFYELEDPISGSIAVFDSSHSEVNQIYGHIGIIKKTASTLEGTKKILIQGANHPVHNNLYFQETRCNNVSLKWYELNDHIKFYDSRQKRI